MEATQRNDIPTITFEPEIGLAVQWSEYWGIKTQGGGIKQLCSKAVKCRHDESRTER
jgi:hypothetical protein